MLSVCRRGDDSESRRESVKLRNRENAKEDANGKTSETRASYYEPSPCIQCDAQFAFERRVSKALTERSVHGFRHHPVIQASKQLFSSLVFRFFASPRPDFIVRANSGL